MLCNSRLITIKPANPEGKLGERERKRRREGREMLRETESGKER